MSYGFGDVFVRKYITWTWPWHWVTHNIAQHPLHHVTHAPAELEVATSNGLGDVFTINVKVTWNIVHYPLHYVSYAPVKFEVAVSNGLGGDRITWNIMDGRSDRRMEGRAHEKILVSYKYVIVLPRRDTKESTRLLRHITTEKSGLCQYAVCITQNTTLKKKQALNGCK